MKDGGFEISKIPDIYDCIKYDLQHNQKTLQYERATELFKYSKALADIVIPQVIYMIIYNLPIGTLFMKEWVSLSKYLYVITSYDKFSP